MATILFSLYLSQCDYMASPIKRWSPFFSSPEAQLALWRMQWEYQQASSGPGPQEAPHASTRTPGSLPTPCVNKPGLAYQRMKDHMEHGRATQLKPLRPVSPQPTQSPATAAYMSSATTAYMSSPRPAQTVEPQNGEWINRCFKPTWFVMQQKLIDTVGIYVYRKLFVQ